MEPKALTAELSVSEQVQPGDVRAVKAAGFRTIICNRPDGEGPDQPTFEEIAMAARKEGLEIVYLPVDPSMVKDEDAADFDKALAELPGPVLAFCRTGTRCATLWSLGQAGKRSLADILAATKAAGYDMSGVVARIVS